LTATPLKFTCKIKIAKSGQTHKVMHPDYLDTGLQHLKLWGREVGRGSPTIIVYIEYNAHLFNLDIE
jgi:hypothetical protein